MKRGGIPSFPSPQEHVEEWWKNTKNEEEKERRVSVRCIIYPVGVCAYSGRSLVEAMPSQQRPLSTPDMFNPLVRQPFVSALSPLVPRPRAARERERDTWRTRYRRTHTYAHSRGQEKRVHRDWPFPLHRGAGRFRTASRNGLLPWLNAP